MRLAQHMIALRQHTIHALTWVQTSQPAMRVNRPLSCQPDARGNLGKMSHVPASIESERIRLSYCERIIRFCKRLRIAPYAGHESAPGRSRRSQDNPGKSRIESCVRHSFQSEVVKRLLRAVCRDL